MSIRIFEIVISVEDKYMKFRMIWNTKSYYMNNISYQNDDPIYRGVKKAQSTGE